MAAEPAPAYDRAQVEAADLLIRKTLSTLDDMERIVLGNAPDTTEERWRGTLDGLLGLYEQLGQVNLTGAEVPIDVLSYIDRLEDPDRMIQKLQEDEANLRNRSSAQTFAIDMFHMSLSGLQLPPLDEPAAKRENDAQVESQQ
eukprot:TRINITY_DN7007_c0_g1_i1.p1 TRINITY_DN7007_c0_g1~~TRINITY_DN7007_c0_g1_i1.p1  ORF type:complete len:143 (-),score=31.19 TRINITY_DN7007_c0_g1_i1:27-455(-)